MGKKRGGLTLRSQAINVAVKTPEKKEGVSIAKPKKPPQRVNKEVDPERVVRDSFTMPSDDYGLIAELQIDSAKLGIIMTKGEILRAGLRSLAGMTDAQLKKAVAKVEKIKTGRPTGR